MKKMYGINIELTTCCPLHCPQCYCTLTGGKHIDIEIAKKKIVEAGAHGVKQVHLSGGETMCYPYLYELIECAAVNWGEVNVALSGYKFDSMVLNKLINSGVSGIFISLNGSTKEINELTRDGYELAINALKCLSENNFDNTYLNWVMHSNNCDDFLNMISLAEKYKVKNLVILSFKPDSNKELLTFPSGEQIRMIASQIKSYSGTVKIGVETCFSQMLAVLLDTPLFGNLNVGANKGCRAGKYNYCINVDGYYSPCRHLDYYENYDSLEEYLNKSTVIKQIEEVEKSKREPCNKCKYSDYCKPCLAVNSKMNNDIYIGHKICSLWQ